MLQKISCRVNIAIVSIIAKFLPVKQTNLVPYLFSLPTMMEMMKQKEEMVSVLTQLVDPSRNTNKQTVGPQHVISS